MYRELEPAIYRERFAISDPAIAYLDGNSLGRLPLRTSGLVSDIVNRQWGERLITSWNEYWLGLSRSLGEKVGQIIGADAGETIISDSTSVNLYKLAAALLTNAKSGQCIVTDDANFPSDLYILQGLVDWLGRDIKLKVIEVNKLPYDEIDSSVIAAIGEDTALVCLSHVHYQSGFAYNLKRINDAAHKNGASSLWDFSHSVGAMPIDVHQNQCDAGVGCCYKYLNGGPGAPAFLYLRQQLWERVRSPIEGWFGANLPFEFSKVYHSAQGIEKFLVGTPPILSLAAIEPGLDLILEAGIDYLRERSIYLGDLLINGITNRLAKLDYELVSPSNAVQRGSHISISHRNGWQITQALIQRYGVIPDFRRPNIIRFGITPLYTTSDEIHRAVEGLERAILERSYLDFPESCSGVT